MVMDHATLVIHVYERFLVMVLAGTSELGEDEVVVDPHGWSIGRWMWHAGVGSAAEGNPAPAPAAPLHRSHPGPLDTGQHNPTTVAEAAMRRLIREGRAEKLRFTHLYRVPARAPDGQDASRV